MSNRSKQTHKTGNVSDFNIFQCLHFNILKSGNLIPSSYHFCTMERDHGSGNPRSWSKNQFLLDEGVLRFWF